MMRQSVWRIVFLVDIFLGICLLNADGFVMGTLIHAQQQIIPIEQCKVGDIVVAKNQEEISFYSITHAIQFIANSYVKINVGSDCIYATQDQQFYDVNKNRWCKAYQLQPLDRLLSITGESVVESVEIVYEQREMCALSIQTNHTFCVGIQGIIAHNMEPASTTAMVVTLAATCPPAAVAVAIGEAIAFGVTGFLMYRVHKKLQKNKKKLDGCFPLNDNPSKTKVSGCYSSENSVRDSIVGCGVVEDQIKTVEVIPYVMPDEIGGICAFPIVAEKPILCNYAAENDCEKNEQYPGPWYNRTEDWINEHPFGQKIKKSLERSTYTNQGKRVFEVSKKIEDCEGFNKGDYIVVDAMHKDHLEVFGANKQWKSVANFNGTKNIEKTKQGQKEPRHPLR